MWLAFVYPVGVSESQVGFAYTSWKSQLCFLVVLLAGYSVYQWFAIWRSDLTNKIGHLSHYNRGKRTSSGFQFFFLSNTLSPTSWDWKSICPFISLVSLVSCFRGQLVGSLQIFLQHTSMLCMNQISYILGSIERTLIHARSISPLLTIWLNGAALWQGHLGIRHCPHFFTF